MTLLRLIQRASILAGMTFASLAVYGNPAHADTPQFCAVTSNGQTACGTLKTIERLCVTTDGTNTICGKFKSFKPAGQEQGQEARQPIQGSIPRTVVNNIAFSLKGCSRSDTTVKCSLLVKNKGAEKNITIYGNRATITDLSGKTYTGISVEIGGKINTYNTVNIAPEIDYEAILAFENIPEGVRKIQVLSMPFESKTVNLRNISISN